jgi:hypothetical protein
MLKTIGFIPGINPKSKIQNLKSKIGDAQNHRIYPRNQSKIQNPKSKIRDAQNSRIYPRNQSKIQNPKSDYQ